MVTTVHVTVEYAAIQELFEPSGGVGRFGQRVNGRARTAARAYAPSDTGRLRNSITSAPAAGRLVYHVTVLSRLDYAGWVNNGTFGPILPKHSPWLAVGKRNPTGKYGKVHYVYPPKGVSGQAAQHFLEDGIETGFAQSGLPISLISF